MIIANFLASAAIMGLLHSVLYGTCVSSWQSRKLVTLLELRAELKTNFSLLGSIFSSIFFVSFELSYNLNGQSCWPIFITESQAYVSADIHSHKAGTQFTYKLLLSRVYLRFFFKSTTFGYAQPWWATLALSKWLRHNAIKG